jgi:hypothetical protein
MDPQIAAQFLGTLAQICATIFAVYLAAMIYVFQEKREELLRTPKRTALLLITFLTGCTLYSITLVYALSSLVLIDPSSSFPDSTAQGSVIVFFLSLLFSFVSITVLLKTLTEG